MQFTGAVSTGVNNLTLYTTGAVTQDGGANLTAAGLELLGTGGAYTLTNTGNAISALAGNTGSVSYTQNSSFEIGTVNTVGLVTTGNLTLSSTGAVTQSQRISAAVSIHSRIILLCCSKFAGVPL